MATGLYKQTNNTIPTYGESNQSVGNLQTQLNEANKNTAGYVPLAVDSKYGDLTKAAVAKYGTGTQVKGDSATATPVPPIPNIADTSGTPATIYGSVNTGGVQESPEAKAARLALEENAKTTGNQTVDEETIRANTLKNFQAEIDAQNSLYADKLREARIAGQGRLGTNTAIQARRGLLGSDFGTAATNTVSQGNTDIETGIEAERAAKIASILSDSRTAADKSIAEKTAAKKAGLESYLQYLSEGETRKATNATKAAQLLLAQQHSPDDINPTDLQTIADNYGITPDQLKAAYSTEKVAQANEAKKNYIKVGEGENYYDPATGKVVFSGAPKIETDTVNAGGRQLLINKKTGDIIKDLGKAPASNSIASLNILSASDAQALGVPYGTTVEEAAGMNITPQKALTDAQGKDLTYAQRSETANDVINNLSATIASMNPISYSGQVLAENNPLGNKYVSNDIRQVRQAQRDFVTSVLRRESGAAISPSEFATAEKQYFPQPGDDAGTIAQKAKNRETAISSFKIGAGPQYNTLTGGEKGGNTSKVLAPAEIPAGYYQASDGLIYKK